MSITTKKITYCALFIAIAVVLSVAFRSLSAAIFPVPFLRFSLAPAIIILAGAVLGYGYGAVVGAITDVLTFLIIPTGGAFLPMFTLTMALYGVLGALFFYKKATPVWKIVLVTILIQTILSAFLNTMWNIYLYGPMDVVKLTSRLLTSYIGCAVFIAILIPLLKMKDKVFKQVMA